MDRTATMSTLRLPIETFIDRLSRLTPEERRQVIEADPLPANVGALLDEAAAEVADKPAWNFFEAGIVTTYSELAAEVNRTANALRAWGVTRGTHIAAMLPNIPAMPTIWLAVAKLGAVMAPVNVRYTGRELRYIVNDSEAEFLILHADYRDLLSPDLDSEEQVLARPAGRIALLAAEDAGPYRRWEEIATGHSP